MSQRSLLFLISVLVLTSTFARSQSDDSTNVPPNELMKKISWLEGTWTGEGDIPGVGKYSSVVTYTLDLNGHIIHHDYQGLENGKVVWRDQGVMAYNDELKEIVGTTIGIDGSYSDGEGTIDSIGQYVLVGHTAGTTPYKDWRSIITRIDDSTARTRFEVKKASGYEFFSEELMKKKK